MTGLPPLPDAAAMQAIDAACQAVLRLPRRSDTLSALFEDRAARFGAAPFLHYGERVRSWHRTAGDVAACAAWLRGHARPGDRVAAILPNCDTLVILLLACARARLVFVPVNPALAPPELAAALAAVTPAIVVGAAAERERLAGILPEPAPELLLLEEGLDLPALPAAAAPADEPQPDDPLVIVFTSGTTGVPKGAVHVNRTYVTAAEIAVWRMRLNGQDRVLVILPLFHLNALFYSVGGAILAGARLVVEERFSAAGFWPVVRRHGITQVNMIAAVGNILLKRDRAEFPGNETLRKVSAAPVTAEVAEALRREFGILHVVESYGMTEAPGICQVDFFDRDHRACLGRPIRHPLTGAPVSEVRVVDGERRELPRGQVGRIMLRATTLMRGYFNRPELADRVDPEGWFLTEDLGLMDADGYVYFRGRTADLIRSRGENVGAAEVEAALLTHPAVSEVGVVGVPSELGEEDILAAIALRPGASLDPAALAAHLDGRLARHKWPRWLVLRDELPKTATQKVAHHRLRAEPELKARALELPGPAGGGKA